MLQGFFGLGISPRPCDVGFDCLEPGRGGEAVDDGQIAKIEEGG